ncbi:YmfQ family protein [Paenibacillus sp. IB182493]|uniref:YmfQ family protein n=2 Tax=Paenibacillus arenilitoris TaxID=2772299 RepID=A0A927CGM3_9BACL|nr:YmfQ family protein [Paenibacillus arenilitoris]
MEDYLPNYYADSNIVANLTEQEARELTEYHARARDVLNQFFIDTATWGLARWEEICGIPVNESKPIDQRRSYIKSKIRGAGTVTLAVIKNVVDSFQNGQVDIQENFGNYEVVITFIGKRGIPPNLNDVKSAVREIVPAHLNVLFKFTYLRWEELDAANLTWDQLEALGMDWDELEVWKP